MNYNLSFKERAKQNIVIKLIIKYKKIIVFSICFLFIFYNHFYINEKRQKEFYEIRGKSILAITIPEGIVINKFIDSSYGARNAPYVDIDGTVYSINRSLYKKISIGDKIKKYKNSYKIYINDIENEYSD